MKIYIRSLFLFIFMISPLFLKSAALEHVHEVQAKDKTISEKSIELQSAYSSYTKNKLPIDTILTNGPQTDKKIALTFDDGPDDQYTLQILNVLKKHNVKATFFLLGIKTKEYPYIAQQIAKEGHVIGNHTYNHPNLSKENLQTFKAEVKKTQEQILQTTGVTPSLFRAPYGNIEQEQLTELKNMKLTAVGWSIDSLDWKSLPSKVIETNVMPNIHSGSIILMHCAGHYTQNLTGTANALDEMIPKLKEEGYEFVTIPELMNKKFVKEQY